MKVLFCVLLSVVIIASVNSRIFGDVTFDESTVQPSDMSIDDPCSIIKCNSTSECVVIYPNCLEGASTDCKPKGVCVPKKIITPPRNARQAGCDECPSWTECRSGFCVPTGRRRRSVRAESNSCATILCPMHSTCIDGKCVPLPGNPGGEPIQIRKARQSDCCPPWDTESVCENGQCVPI